MNIVELNDTNNQTHFIDGPELTYSYENDIHWFLCFLLTFALGGLAAIISKTISAPIEKIKIVKQTHSISTASDDNISEMNIFKMFRWVYRKMGCLAFWDGNTANVIRYVPKFALDMAISVSDKFGMNSPPICI